MKKFFHFYIFIVLNHFATGQNTSLTVEARIFDFTTSNPVPYASVYISGTGNGTLSNHSGYFKLSNVDINDTLIISFIGYEKLKIKTADAVKSDTIFLYPKTELLTEVVILSDDSFLYDLVSASKKKVAHDAKTSKTYFELESYVNQKQVELVECYYNGIFYGHDISALQLKNGRFALAPFGERLFMSTQTSEALIMNKLFENHPYFPVGPLALSRGQLKKQFYLSLRSKYKTDSLSCVYVIDFKPKDTSGTFFTGTVWIDSLQGSLLKVTHQITNATLHPFALIGRNDSLLNVCLQISKTFHPFEEGTYLNAVDFNYSFQYRYLENDSVQTITSRAILYAYDYKNLFTLPCFEFTESMYGDYVKILATPYNSIFWNNIHEFKLNDQKNENDLFFLNNGNKTSEKKHLNRADSLQWNFEKPYIRWSENRVIFREDLNDNIVQTKIGGVPSDFYNLKVQLYLDMNAFNDTLHVLTATIFDPFQTYFYYPINAVSLTFINVYFDLMEIQRRELEAEISAGEKNKEVVLKIYQNKMQNIKNISADYFKETERGTNEKAMLKWNDVVLKKLNIDNVALFNPYEKTK